tara:strand:- start:464 stop:1582 length:1119 start_codon:yes stop_codon:yes gene_type:complete
MITVIHVSIFAFIILVMLIILKINGYEYDHEGFENNTTDIVSREVPKLKRPFVNLFDQQGRLLNVFLISKPFSGDEQNKIYLDNKDGNIYLGVSSYLEFPNKVSNPFEDFTENYKKYRYKEITKGWIHCFKNPEGMFPPQMPLLFSSESDWTDCNYIKPDPKITEKKYDFIYICLKVDEKLDKCDDWATYNKNWELAQKCLDVMCNKYKLKGLLIGRKGCKLPKGCHDLMETTNMVKYGELRELYQKSKFIFLPNEKDASPRVLTEAMCMNIPTLINKNILGGWKYINDKTGQFFTDENDVGQNIEIMMNKLKNNEYEPRKYFVENYGPIASGKKFKTFLYKHWGDQINIPESEVEYVTPEFPKKDYKQCEV